MLPKKSFMTKDCLLYESDFDVTACVKLHRVMELMQDLATTHADNLGCGWDDMDKHGLFWILSKVKIEFYKPVTRHSRRFTLYTWPQPSNRLFIERRFSAVDGSGEELFSASTIWMILNRDNRVFASQQSIGEMYRCDFDTAPCTCSAYINGYYVAQSKLFMIHYFRRGNKLVFVQYIQSVINVICIVDMTVNV